MPKSVYLANALLDTVLGRTSYSQPSALYFGLLLSYPSETDESFTEVSGIGYSRAVRPNNSSLWPVAADKSKSNSIVITFSGAGAGGWGTVVAFGIFDAISGGNLLYYGMLDAERLVEAGDSVAIPPGKLTITDI